MRFDAFISGSYELSALVADCQRTVDLIPELIESGSGRSRARLMKRPGLFTFVTLGSNPVRKMIEINGRAFAIAGGTFYEIFSGGTSTSRGTVSSSGWASMAASKTQVIVAAGGALSCFTLATNVLTPIAPPAAEWVTQSDNYFIAMEPNTQKIYISGILDGLTWDPADVASAEAKPDNLVQIVADHREVWLFGSNSIQPYYDSGNADFPFDPIAGGTIETGIIGKTACQLDNTLFWVSADERGNGMVQRADGYRPVRVSNHAVEQDLQSGVDLANAEAYAYQDQGHAFYVLCVPGQARNWAYDVSTQLWHERCYRNTPAGLYEAHRGWCHCFAFGRHLIGDRVNGKIYEQSVSYYDDAGDLIRWMRRSPHLANENKRNFYASLELVMDTGVGLVDGTDPSIIMRFSNDGGRNWSNESYAKSYGKMGETTKRVKWNRLGSARDRVFEVAGTDRVPVTIVDALLEVEPEVN